MKLETPQLAFSFAAPQILPRGDGSFVVSAGKPKAQLTPAEFGRSVGVSEQTARRWIHDGTIPQQFVTARGKARWWIAAEAVDVVRQALTDQRLNL